MPGAASNSHASEQPRRLVRSTRLLTPVPLRNGFPEDGKLETRLSTRAVAGFLSNSLPEVRGEENLKSGGTRRVGITLRGFFRSGVEDHSTRRHVPLMFLQATDPSLDAVASNLP